MLALAVNLDFSRELTDTYRLIPYWKICLFLMLFFLGAFVMRGAGCTYNDLVDQDIDDKVARTRSRPLPSGRVTRKNAAVFLGASIVDRFDNSSAI